MKITLDHNTMRAILAQHIALRLRLGEVMPQVNPEQCFFELLDIEGNPVDTHGFLTFVFNPDIAIEAPATAPAHAGVHDVPVNKENQPNEIR